MLAAPLAAAMAAAPAIGFSIGHVGIFDELDEPAIASAEYRFETDGWRLDPAIGLTVTANGASFVYADVHYTFWINDDWVLRPSFGIGRFGGDDEIDLGNLVEFRTGFEIARRFRSGWQLGLVLHHFSNGGISERNPGMEELALTLSVPLGE